MAALHAMRGRGVVRPGGRGVVQPPPPPAAAGPGGKEDFLEKSEMPIENVVGDESSPATVLRAAGVPWVPENSFGPASYAIFPTPQPTASAEPAASRNAPLHYHWMFAFRHQENSMIHFLDDRPDAHWLSRPRPDDPDPSPVKRNAVIPAGRVK